MGRVNIIEDSENGPRHSQPPKLATETCNFVAMDIDRCLNLEVLQALEE